MYQNIGIYRKIPLENKVIRTDGTASTNKAKVTNLSVNENYTASTEFGYKVIKIGNKSRTLTGQTSYVIKYNYDIGKDPLKNADELYYNLIGDQWDARISNVTFRIIMPKSFDKSLLGFSSGARGSVNSSQVDYSVDGNVISGSLKNTLNAGEALTVRLTLPEGYFVGKKIRIDMYSVSVIAFSLACVLIAYLLWAKYGKDDQVVETVEFYPPEGYNSAEVGFLYEGFASTQGVISLLIYLANKGYLKIEETEEQGLFKKSKSFKITKIKEYDGNNENERLFFAGLFYKTKHFDLKKIEDIIETAKQSGRKISFQEAMELAEKTADRTYITESDLRDSFYVTLDKVKNSISSKENKEKIFERSASKKVKWLIIMSIAIYLLITIKPIIDYGDTLTALPILLTFNVAGFFAMFAIIFGTKTTMHVNGKATDSKIAKVLFGLLFGSLFGIIPWAIITIPALIYNFMYLVMGGIGVICIVALIAFARIIPKRTPYGNEVLGKLRGFKRFLETAEKSQLENLVAQNPEYFYNILPYTYALGISDVWISQFETIAIKAPNWYYSTDGFSMNTFGTFMSSTMKSATTAMSSSPSSSSGFSGGGSSGGGSSGGGSGGGGGGSW